MDLAFHWPVLISLASAAVNLPLAILVLRKNPNGRMNRVFGLLAFLLFLWGIGEAVLRMVPQQPDFSTSDYGFAVAMSRLSWSCVVYGSFVMMWFSTLLAMPKKGTLLGKVGMPLLLVGLALVALVWIPGMFLKDPDGVLWTSVGYTGNRAGTPGYLVFMVVYLFLTAIIFTSLVKALKSSENVIQRGQIYLAFVGMLALILIGGVSQVFLPAIGIYDLPIGTLTGVVMGVCFGYDMLKYDLFEIEAVTESGTAEMPPEVETKHRLEPGFAYLITERETATSYEIFRGLVGRTPGLCLTTFYPPKFREEYRLEKTPMIWLTETKTDERAIAPARLEFEMSYVVSSFMKENPQTVVLIDDVQYLIATNGFDKVHEFLKYLVDLAAMNDSILIVPLNPAIFEELEYSALKSLFDNEIAVGERPTGSGLPAIKPSYAYLFEEERPQRSYELVSSIGKNVPTMCITKTYPKKLKGQFGLDDTEFIWLSTTLGDERAVDPNRLAFEIMSGMQEFMHGRRRPVMLVDGLDLLVLKNGFDEVNDFTKCLIDAASVAGAAVIFTIQPGSLDEKEMAMIRKRFDVLVAPGFGEWGLEPEELARHFRTDFDKAISSTHIQV